MVRSKFPQSIADREMCGKEAGVAMGNPGRKRSGECRAPAKRSSWRCAKPVPERLCPHHGWRVRDVKALGREAGGNHSELSGLGKEGAAGLNADRL